MAGGIKKLGAAFVELFADKSRLESDLKSAKNEVAQATGEMSKSGKDAAMSMQGVGESLKESTKPARSLLQGLLSIRSVAFGIVSVFSAVAAGIGVALAVALKLKDAIFGSEAEAKKLNDTFKKTEEIVEKTNAGIREQLRMQAKLRGDNSDSILGDEDEAAILKRLEHLGKRIESTKKSLKEEQTPKNVFSDVPGDLDLHTIEKLQKKLETLMQRRARLDALLQSIRDTAAEKEHQEELARISKENKARIEGILSESKAKREAAQSREFENMLRDGLIGLYQQQMKEQASAAAHQILLQNEAHAKLMEQRQEQHAAMMRAVEEFKSKLQGEFTALGGLRRLADIPAILEKIRSGL